MILPEAHELFRRLLEPANDLVITTHVNPDGDGLGSEFGLASFLASRGKNVRLVNQDPTPEVLRFLERDSVTVEVYRPGEHDAVLAQSDLVVLVDNSAPDRLGRMEDAMRAVAERTLCIDHHPAREMPWAHQILDEGTCATAVMIYELTRRCGWRPDPRSAEALYVGLVTDTGFFRFNSTNPQAHEVAAELLRLGVQPARAYQAVYERNPAAFTRLLGHALAGLRIDGGGAVASVRITRELLASLEAEDMDTSEVTTSLLATDGISVALLFRELDGQRIKVSLRSKGSVDVYKLATEFGGGGHRNASGIVMQGRLDDVARLVTGRASALVVAAGR